VTVFRPVREAEVIFMQQVTEIYGGEGGWDSLAWHGFTTMSIHTRQEIWCVILSLRQEDSYLIGVPDCGLLSPFRPPFRP